MKNLYHILHKKPALMREEMEIEYEDLVYQLLDSGLMRFDTYSSRNFVNFLDPDISTNITLSKEQLGEALIKTTQHKLTNIYSKKFNGAVLKNKVQKTLNYFKHQMAKNVDVDKNLALKLIRLLVQATHPIVIRWVLLEKVEIFISYSYNIGDVMDVVTWQYAGSNSGMQSTDGRNVAVFVSCGGDPFRETNANNPIYGDGWPAMARLQIIAAQELGHYSDIKRNSKGMQIGRHSANFAATRAEENVKQARRQDIQNANLLYKKLVSIGLSKLIRKENDLKFYKKNKVSGLKVLFLNISTHISRLSFLARAKKHGLNFVRIFYDQYLGNMLQAMLYDMLFNLTPQADVYNKQDPDEDEAIKCVEALARVPQQVMKWGYVTTKTVMPGLYQIYYKQVIPSLISAYDSVTGQNYQRDYTKFKPGIIYKIKRFFYKDSVKPIREL
jgi:hypothetical protein